MHTLAAEQMEENTEVQRYKNEAEDGIYFDMPRESARSQQVSHQGYGKPSCMTVAPSLTFCAEKKKRVHVAGKGPSPATNRKKDATDGVTEKHQKGRCKEGTKHDNARRKNLTDAVWCRSVPNWYPTALSSHLGHSVQVTDMT